jgi:TonB family protein
MKPMVLIFMGAVLVPLSCALAQESKQPYEYMRGEYVVPCPDDENENCIWQRLVVDNQSANTLECRGRIAYDSVNRDQLAAKEHRMAIEPNTRKAVLSDTTKPDVKSTSHGVDCIVRKPYDDSKLTPNCKPTLTKKPTGGIDYPPESRSAGEEGPVLLEFSLSDKEGPPTDIAVIGSSLWPKLDESAKKYVAQYAGVTDCKNGRFRMPLTFRLR